LGSRGRVRVATEKGLRTGGRDFGRRRGQRDGSGLLFEERKEEFINTRAR